ncbi:ANTAR domain-containing response regulator [Brevibacillus fulvus]|uniref:Response regulator NasT n=1 Tax=Brevibacillus fulvus TaxID=1125967 RepID=A0A939BS51_9BACL|nr:ANTAR domain-containing protein [Brevibacillus fulvus]MBM7590342.1 response regulator NasT [Brevibacillus fulvus]
MRVAESLLLISHSGKNDQIKTKLSTAGFSVLQAMTNEEVQRAVPMFDAVILHMPPQSLSSWCRDLRSYGNIPLIWWCDDHQPHPDKLLDADIDGVLFPSMSSEELHWAYFVTKSLQRQRTQLKQEHEMALLRLEERKWIDQAKRILCEMKKIPEEEAFAFLRKSAMNERKRMVDVARSMVKVYQLIQEQKINESIRK